MTGAAIEVVGLPAPFKVNMCVSDGLNPNVSQTCAHWNTTGAGSWVGVARTG